MIQQYILIIQQKVRSLNFGISDVLLKFIRKQGLNLQFVVQYKMNKVFISVY